MAMEPNINKAARYYLRIPDGTIFGSVDLATLCVWATDARVIPGCELSINKELWFPVENVPELRLNWSVQLLDGTLYGPLNLLAVWVLAAEKSISSGVRLSEKGTGRKAVLDDSLIPLLVEEMHQMLAGCGVLMASVINALHEAHRSTLSQVAACDIKLSDVRSQQEKSQDDLGALARNLQEAQSTLQAKEALIQQLEKTTAHAQAQADIRATETVSKMAILNETLEAAQRQVARLSTQLVHSQEAAQKAMKEGHAAALAEAKVALQAKDCLIHQLETDLAQQKAQAEIQMTVLRGQAEVLEKQRVEIQQHSDSLTSQLTQLQERYEALVKESALKENESSAKLKRIEKEIADSTELVAKTLREVEIRERRMNEMQQNKKVPESPFPPMGAVVDAEVIHAEVLQTDEVGYEHSGKWCAVKGTGEKSSGRQGVKPGKTGVLNNVEARLQKELRHWEVLKREKKDQKTSSPKWF